ncbi:hypothetical protein VP01_821g1 [Puccinia sorghi]|uniref:Uncharacterized protein n=1 Tax=Puccinia sorghi TaxID=27349 RepID=A0A0L6UA21_9BASI|nr:hypothetical protein VP01_821g1 [Puccinia sorghi]
MAHIGMQKHEAQTLITKYGDMGKPPEIQKSHTQKAKMAKTFFQHILKCCVTGSYEFFETPNFISSFVLKNLIKNVSNIPPIERSLFSFFVDSSSKRPCFPIAQMIFISFLIIQCVQFHNWLSEEDQFQLSIPIKTKKLHIILHLFFTSLVFKMILHTQLSWDFITVAVCAWKMTSAAHFVGVSNMTKSTIKISQLEFSTKFHFWGFLSSLNAFSWFSKWCIFEYQDFSFILILFYIIVCIVSLNYPAFSIHVQYMRCGVVVFRTNQNHQNQHHRTPSTLTAKYFCKTQLCWLNELEKEKRWFHKQFNQRINLIITLRMLVLMESSKTLCHFQNNTDLTAHSSLSFDCRIYKNNKKKNPLPYSSSLQPVYFSYSILEMHSIKTHIFFPAATLQAQDHMIAELIPMEQRIIQPYSLPIVDTLNIGFFAAIYLLYELIARWNQQWTSYATHSFSLFLPPFRSNFPPAKLSQIPRITKKPSLTWNLIHTTSKAKAQSKLIPSRIWQMMMQSRILVIVNEEDKNETSQVDQGPGSRKIYNVTYVTLMLATSF